MSNSRKTVQSLAVLCDSSLSPHQTNKQLDITSSETSFFIELATENRVLALLGKNLQDRELPDEWISVINDLNKLCLNTAALNLLFLHHADNILQEARLQNIDMIPLKGIGFIDRIYKPDERQLIDIDIMVKYDQIQQCNSLMNKLQFTTPESCLPDRFSMDYSGEIKYSAIKTGTNIDVELQWDPVPYLSKRVFCIEPEIFWKNRNDNSMLSPEAEILYQIVHLSLRHPYTRLIWFIDIKRLIESSDIDWELLSDYIINSGLSIASRHIFNFLRRYLWLELPHSFIKKLKIGGRETVLDNLIIETIAGNKRLKRTGICTFLSAENKIKLLSAMLFPDRVFMEKRYPNAPLPISYAIRLFDLGVKSTGIQLPYNISDRTASR